MSRKIIFTTVFIIAGVIHTLVAYPQLGWWSAGLQRNDTATIPFTFEWKNEKGKNVWYIKNAEEKIKVSDIQKKGDSLIVQMPVFESQFRVKYSNKKLSGLWIRGSASKPHIVAFEAKPGNKRFINNKPATKNISGRWAVNFASNKPGVISVGEFKQKGNTLAGTFLNPNGDYRYLEGIVAGDSLFLSCFDGSHAYLFTAFIVNDSTISGGNYYAASVYKETWNAVKNPLAAVAKETVAMFVKPGEESLHFSFKDLDGKPVSINDERFKNKVVLVQLMGSWCPNCMDETVMLSDYYNKNKQRGFEVVALAYEYTTDWERSVKSVKKFRDRFNVQYPMLITGVSVTDSLRTEKTLPEVTPIRFFPSSIIIDKKGKIRKIDTDFYGPGTGQQYIIYKKEFEETIESLLKEN